MTQISKSFSWGEGLQKFLRNKEILKLKCFRTISLARKSAPESDQASDTAVNS